MTPLVQYVLRFALAGAAIGVLASQCRKPRWWLGRRVAAAMNLSHSALTDWGLSKVALEPRSSVLDVGCGGGATVSKLAAVASEGRVCGVDYSPASVAAARRVNAKWIEAGRVAVDEASVSHLPFPDATFDLVTAIETHYYWPDPPADLREVWRVLKPGGTLVIIAEAYKGRRFDALYRPVMSLLLRATYLSLDEHRELLTAAGYSQVEVTENRAKGWMAAVGRRGAI